MNVLRLPVCALVLSTLVTPVALAADAGADLLDWALGEWTGTRTDAADRSVAPMRMLVEALPGGSGQVARLEVNSDGDSYVGFIVRLPDLETGHWSMVYANNARMKFARLQAASTGERMTWISETAVPPRRSRLTEERLDGDRWRRTQEVSSDDGASWRVLFVDELERVK